MSAKEIKVFVVHASDEGCSDNSGFEGEGYTISKDRAVAGWETDSGHSSYGLKKEDAEYYAKCINEYPKLLSLIDRYKKGLERIKEESASLYITRLAKEALEELAPTE